MTIEKIAEQISHWHAERDGLLCVGISGSQGSGKTTLTRALVKVLSEQYGLSVVQFSLDDLYKTKAQRQQMAQDVHPLFATRTLPGTHDLELGAHVFQSLKAGQPTAIPCFDKAIDDRTAEETWEVVETQPDIVLFEGWCVGATALPEASLKKPINDFEAQHDPDALWRTAINQYLKQDYPALWSVLDKLIFIQIPSFESVFQWRKRQESETFANTPENAMTDEEIREFIGQAERITTHNMTQLPSTADMTIQIDDLHRITHLTHKSSQS